MLVWDYSGHGQPISDFMILRSNWTSLSGNIKVLLTTKFLKFSIDDHTMQNHFLSKIETWPVKGDHQPDGAEENESHIE